MFCLKTNNFWINHKANHPDDIIFIPVELPIFLIYNAENGIKQFIFRKKHAGKSTQFEFVTEENDGVLGKKTRRVWTLHGSHYTRLHHGSYTRNVHHWCWLHCCTLIPQISNPLLSTGWDPVISGAMGSL